MREFGDNPCIGCSDKGIRCNSCKHNQHKKKSHYEPDVYPRYNPMDRYDWIGDSYQQMQRVFK